MKLLDLTLTTPQLNLACDEAILDLCESGFEEEILRFWEPTEYFVVLGYTNKLLENINAATCSSLQIPVLRRCSGGGTVVQGPGCFNYTLVLDSLQNPELTSIGSTTNFVLSRHREVIEQIAQEPVLLSGISDLTIRNLKFSGNAQRRKKRFILFHGTFLIGMDIALIEKVLLHPTEEPEYRGGRSHESFLINLQCSSSSLRSALRRVWSAKEKLSSLPCGSIEKLASGRYSDQDWIARR